MTSIPPPSATPAPPGPPPHPAPPELPELPPGVERSPQRPRWPAWSAWLALVAGFGGALGGALVIGVIAGIAGADFDDPPPGVNIAAIVVQDASLILAAILFARMAAPVRPWQFGLRPMRFWPGVGIVVGSYVTFVLVAAAWAAALSIDEEDTLPQELGADESTAAMIAVGVLVTVMAPLAEELFFRGYFFPALRSWRGFWPAAIITGVVFGAIHAGGSPLGFLPPLMVFGFLLCVIYQRTGSLYPCIALHCLNNTVAYGVTMDWGWEIVPWLAGSLAVLALILAAVSRAGGPIPATRLV